MQRRLLLAPRRADRPADEIDRHWAGLHAALVQRLPGLAGYVQLPPPAGGPDHGSICAETWFASREAETSALTGRHYRQVVAPDETLLVDRSTIWSSAIVDDGGDHPNGRYRVLAVGTDEHSDLGGGTVRAHVLRLARPRPGGGAAALSAWTDDLGEACALARRWERPGVTVLVTEPRVVTAPPGWPPPTPRRLAVPGCPERPGTLHAVDFRLSYADCDPAGIVYFAAYYRWLERTYSEWTWMMGLGVDRMRPLWGAWTVSKDSGCTYHVPGVLFDHLWCVMRCGRIGTTSSTMAFDIIRSRDEVLVAEGRITLVFLDDSGRPVPVPEAMRIALTGL